MPVRLDDRISISDEEDLWRRVFPDRQCFKPMDNGQWRPSSAIFLERGKRGDETPKELSVHRSSLTTIEAVFGPHPYHSLAAIKASVPRELGYAVCPDPIKNEPGLTDDPSHALICPPPGAGISKPKANARQMALKATWVVLRNPPF